MKYEAWEDIPPEIEGDAPINLHMDDDGLFFSFDGARISFTNSQWMAVERAIKDFKTRTKGD